MDPAAFSAYVSRRIATASSQIFGHFLEDFDPVTATDAEVARGVLLADLANAGRDRTVPLTNHEEQELDGLIAVQPPRLWEMHGEVRKTDARHVLCLLRGIEDAKTAGTYTEPQFPEPKRGWTTDR